jgi:hypothetical protein
LGGVEGREGPEVDREIGVGEWGLYGGGLKVAMGVEGVSSASKGVGGKVKVGVGGLVGGVPVGMGSKGEVRREIKDGVIWEMGEGEGEARFAFAYRLVRIKRKGKEGRFKEGDFNKGAVFDDEVGGKTDEENK